MPNMNRIDIQMLRISHIIAESSTCVRLHVGAVITDKNNHIISTGYNGTVSGAKHCNEMFSEEDKNSYDFLVRHHEFSIANEIHAEQNAIANACKIGIHIDNSTIYITDSPCIHCAKLIIASGIKRVVYNRLYEKDTKFMILFKENNIEYKEIKII